MIRVATVLTSTFNGQVDLDLIALSHKGHIWIAPLSKIVLFDEHGGNNFVIEDVEIYDIQSIIDDAQDERDVTAISQSDLSAQPHMTLSTPMEYEVVLDASTGAMSTKLLSPEGEYSHHYFGINVSRVNTTRTCRDIVEINSKRNKK